MNNEQFKSAYGLVQAGFFDLEPVASNGTDEITVIADWSGLSKEEVEQEASKYHDELEKREKQLDAIISFAEEQKKSVICEKSDLYSHMKATRTYDEWLAWLKSINTSKSTAFECMQLAREYRTELTSTTGGSRLLSRNQIRAIHRTGEGHEILAKVNSGDINPTWEALNKEIEAANQRAKELEDKLEAEKRAHSLFKEDTEFNNRTKEQAYVALKQKVTELENKPVPEPITVYRDTLETAAKFETLKQQIDAIKAKPDISPEKQKELDKLQIDLKNAKTELDFYTNQNKALADKNRQLSEESRRNFVDNITAVGQLRIRQEWQAATSVLQASHSAFHLKIPSEIDRESFEGEEHTRTAQTIQVLEETIAKLKKTLPHSGDILGRADIVDADQSIPATIEPFTTDIDYQVLFAQYQQYVKTFPDEKLWWRAPSSGIMDMEMDRDTHITYTRELLKSGDPYRIRCAIEGMKRTLGYEG